MDFQIIEHHKDLAALVKCNWNLESPKEKTDMVANGNNTVVYFESEDCTTEENRVENAGGKIIRPKMSIGEFGFIALVMDTEGNTIGLHSRQ